MRQYPYIYSQRDPQWASQRLGTVNGITIGGYGCILTCNAMKAGYYGHQITPNALDDIFTNRGIYVQGDLLPDSGIHQVFDDIQLVEVKNFAGIPTDMNYLKEKSQDPTLTVTIEVDFDHNPSDGIQTHFVELHSYDGNTLRIYDPWYGQEDDFTTHYGTDPITTIQKFTVYKGNPGKPQMLVDQDLYAKLVSNSSANDAVCDELSLPHDSGKDKEVAALRQIKTDKATAEQTVSTLNQQLPALKTENEQLAGQIDTLQKQLVDVQNASVHPDSGIDYKSLYEQAEVNLKDTKTKLTDAIEANNRQMAQYQNSSIHMVSLKTIVKIFFLRLFGGKTTN